MGEGLMDKSRWVGLDYMGKAGLLDGLLTGQPPQPLLIARPGEALRDDSAQLPMETKVGNGARDLAKVTQAVRPTSSAFSIK